MAKISFNPQAFSVPGTSHCGDVGHSRASATGIPIVVSDEHIQSVVKRLGFTNVECFPDSENALSAKDVDS